MGMIVAMPGETLINGANPFPEVFESCSGSLRYILTRDAISQDRRTTGARGYSTSAGIVMRCERVVDSHRRVYFVSRVAYEHKMHRPAKMAVYSHS